MAFVAYWGAAYVAACFEALLASSSPIEYKMATKRGIVTFRTETWSVDLEHNRLIAARVTARDADSKLIGSAARLEAFDLIPWPLSRRATAIKVFANGGFAEVERDRGGNLTFLDYQPEVERPSAPVPFSLELTQMRLAITDYYGKQPWKAKASGRRINVLAFGDRFLAYGDLAIAGMGELLATVRPDGAGGVTVDAATKGFDLAPLASHLAQTPDVEAMALLKEAAAEQMLVAGNVHLGVSRDLVVRLDAEVIANGRNILVNGAPYARTALFNGRVTHLGAQGQVAVDWGGGSGAGSGAVNWEKELVAGFRMQAKAASRESLPPAVRNLVAPALKFSNATYGGWLGWNGKHLEASGRATAAWASWERERVVQPAFLVATTSESAVFRIQQAHWSNAPLRGAVSVRLDGAKVAGHLVAKGLDVGAVARRFGIDAVDGSADVAAMITGSQQHPRVAVRGNGTMAVSTADQTFRLGNVDLTAILEGDSLRVSRLKSDGPSGLATAQGVYSLKSGALDFSVFGSDIPAALAYSDLGGTAAFSGKVRGTAKDPKATGRVELYDSVVMDREVPLIVADLEVGRKQAIATQILALQGSARFDGSLAYTYNSGKLNGNGAVSGLSLTDLLGEKFAGTINASRVYVSGTTKNPHVEATIDGRTLVAGGVEIDELSGEAVLDGREVKVSQLVAKKEDGSVTASGTYNFDTKSATYEAMVAKLDLGDFITDPAVILTGLLTGDIKGTFSDAAGFDFSGNGHLDQVAVNGTLVGNGSTEFSAVNGIVKGSGSIGGLDRFIEAPQFEYDIEKRTLAAQVLLHAISLRDLYAISRKYSDSIIAQLPAHIAERMGTLKGDLDADTRISGSITNPDLDVQALALAGIEFDGLEGGDLTAQGRRIGGVWTIDSLSWTGGPGTLSAKGTIEEDGAIDLDGELNNISPAWFAGIDPAIGNLKGKGDISFRATGMTRSPVIDASIGYREGDAEDKDRRQLDLLAKIQEGQAVAEGNYYFEGFTGPITARAPFTYPLGIPEQGEIVVSAELPPRDVKELKDLLPWLDVQKSSGTIAGQMTISGTKTDLKLSGRIGASGGVLAAEGVKSELRDYTLDGLLAEDRVRFDGKAGGPGSGSVSVENVSFSVANLSEMISRGSEGLLESALSGSISAQNFPLQQGQSGEAMFSGGVTGNVNLAGTIKEPILRGALTANKPSFKMGELPATGIAQALMIDPRFDVSIQLADPLALDAGTGKFKLLGGGRLGGSLGQPDVSMDFEVDSGSLRLPNARVVIEPGGTIAVRYRTTPYGSPGAEALVDLVGRTQLTAPGLGDNIDFYSVTLEIRGDILQDNGLQIQASSDPPGLSQDRILALLGQGEILAGRPGSSLNVSDQFRAALSIALPYVIGGVTERIGAGLGLDYLGVEYGGANMLTVTAAKTLGRYFVLSGRRQVSEPLPGQKAKFDIRLSFRPPVRNRFLSRLSFSVGMDQDRPWKVSVEYGIRF